MWGVVVGLYSQVWEEQRLLCEQSLEVISNFFWCSKRPWFFFSRLKLALLCLAMEACVRGVF